jgi:hypothetical protein
MKMYRDFTRDKLYIAYDILIFACPIGNNLYLTVDST